METYLTKWIVNLDAIIFLDIKILKISGAFTSWKIWTWSASDFFLFYIASAYYRKWGDCLLKKRSLPTFDIVSTFALQFLSILLHCFHRMLSLLLFAEFDLPHLKLLLLLLSDEVPALTPALHFCNRVQLGVLDFLIVLAYFGQYSFNNC